jgi:hypothetical protein
MIAMRIRQPASRMEPQKPLTQAFSDLGSQLEDVVTHVMRCERWARFDDRLDLAVAGEESRPADLRARRAGGGRA